MYVILYVLCSDTHMENAMYRPVFLWLTLGMWIVAALGILWHMPLFFLAILLLSILPLVSLVQSRKSKQNASFEQDLQRRWRDDASFRHTMEEHQALIECFSERNAGENAGRWRGW